MKLPKDPDWKKKDRDLARRARAIHAPRGFKARGDGIQFSDRRYVVGPAGNYIRVHPTRPWRGKSERRQVVKARHQLNPDMPPGARECGGPIVFEKGKMPLFARLP